MGVRDGEQLQGDGRGGDDGVRPGAAAGGGHGRDDHGDDHRRRGGDAGGDCSLREAVRAADENSNAHEAGCTAGEGGSAVDTIRLAATTYPLTLAGANEEANLTGDLDLRTGGAGPAVITGAEPADRHKRRRTRRPGAQDTRFDDAPGTDDHRSFSPGQQRRRRDPRRRQRRECGGAGPGGCRAAGQLRQRIGGDGGAVQTPARTPTTR